MSRVEGFAAVPTWMIRDKSIPRSALLVYASLSSRSGLGAIFPSQASIAEEAGLSERTVRTMLGHLESIGVIERARRKTTGLKRVTDAYMLRPNGRIDLAATSAGRSYLPADLPANEGVSTGNEQQTTPSIEVEIEEVEIGTSDVASDALPTGYNPDVYRLCGALAVAVEANGHKVGQIGKTWWAACDRLMRLDGYSAVQIEWMIRWATADEFWSANIRSMPTLREKFSTLVLQAKRDTQKVRRTSPDARARSVLDMGRELAQEGMGS